MKFHLGQKFYLPETIITETIAVLGIRGSGKTTTAKVIVEEALKRRRQVTIIDPTDSWWGVKSGFEIVVFGGAHGDLPLEEGSGKLIADFVVDYGVSVILSLRHLRKAAQTRLITAFNEQLYFRKGEASKRTPVLVVIDECDAFIPQKVMGENAKSVGAVEDLVRRGRNAGIGVVLISQRAASINKDVLTQLTVLIAHKHTSPQDRKALEEWIRGHDSEDRAKVFLSSLAALPVGTAWVWAPDLDLFERVQIRRSETYDSSATPKLGEKIKNAGKLKPVDLSVLREQMKEAIEEHEANDATKLKEKVRKLEAELKKGAVPVTKTEIVEKNILLKKDQEILHSIEKTLKKCLTDFETLSLQLLQRLPKEAAPIKSVAPIKAEPKTVTLLDYNEHVARRTTRNGNEKLTSGVKRILTVLAQENKTMPSSRVALRAGFPKNSTFRNYMSQARVSGWIEGGGDSIVITEEGQHVLGGDFERIPETSLGRLDYWKSKVTSKQAEILSILYEAGEVSVVWLAERVGMELNSTWRNYISQLRVLGLVKGSKELSLSEDF